MSRTLIGGVALAHDLGMTTDCFCGRKERKGAQRVSRAFERHAASRRTPTTLLVGRVTQRKAVSITARLHAWALAHHPKWVVLLL